MRFFNIDYFFSIVLCVIFYIFPELIWVLLIVLTVIKYKELKIENITKLYLVLLSIYFLPHLLIGNFDNLVYLLAVPLIFIFSFYLRSEIIKKIGIPIIISIILINFTLVFVSQNRHFWQTDAALVDFRATEKLSIFVPKDNNNSGVLYNLRFQGSGTVKATTKIRSDKTFTLNYSFIQWGTKTYRVDNICEVKTVWTYCVITAKLPQQADSAVGFGGYNTWRKNDSPIYIEKISIQKITAPSLVEQLNLVARAFYGRVKGLSFNENAFGAHMAVMGILTAMFLFKFSSTILAISVSLICVLQSGSRGALAAFVIGLLVLFLARSRAYRFLPLITTLVFFVIVLFQFSMPGSSNIPTVQNQTGLRAFDFSDQDSFRGRFELWRLATKAWLENSRTFLIGAGDLSSAMKVQFDTRSSGFGLTKDSLTHAHNLWVQTAGESGLIGLLAMVTLWAWVIRRAWKARDAGALALLAAIFVINSVDYLFFYAPVNLAFWMAAAGFKPSDHAKQLELAPTAS